MFKKKRKEHNSSSVYYPTIETREDLFTTIILGTALQANIILLLQKSLQKPLVNMRHCKAN